MFHQMYLLLFNRITDALKALDRGDAASARAILMQAQQEAEELFMEPELPGGGDRIPEPAAGHAPQRAR